MAFIDMGRKLGMPFQFSSVDRRGSMEEKPTKKDSYRPLLKLNSPVRSGGVKQRSCAARGSKGKGP